MSVFIIGGTGFIGHRLVRLLVERRQSVTSMDINAAAHSFVDLGEKPDHRIYNSSGTSISLGEIADLVRAYLPDARISFDKDSGNYHDRQQPAGVRIGRAISTVPRSRAADH